MKALVLLDALLVVAKSFIIVLWDFIQRHVLRAIIVAYVTMELRAVVHYKIQASLEFAQIFLPMFHKHNFAKLFTAQVFYYMVWKD